ncbi:hypothetical protein ACIBUY_37105 [Streptomyces sp. NPDC050085]
MRLGKALATGYAEETPQDTNAEPDVPELEVIDVERELTPEPVGVPAAR